MGVVNGDEGALPQVAEEDVDHAQGEIEVRREVSHRDGQRGQPQRREVLRLQVRRVEGDSPDRDDHRDHVQRFPGGPRPAADQRIGTDHRSCVLIEPAVFG
jgi:hypothetical protein